MKTIKSFFYIGQCVFSVIVIALGLFYGIRSMIAGQWFLAMCFAAWAINGYMNLWRASISEYRAYRAASRKEVSL